MPNIPQQIFRTQNSPPANAKCAVWFHIRKDIFIAFLRCRISSPPTEQSGLRHSASTKPENGRNEERNQGYHEYDLRGGERGPSDNAETERARDQSNDKKGDRPAEHDVLLTLRWFTAVRTLESRLCSKATVIETGVEVRGKRSGKVGNYEPVDVVNGRCNQPKEDWHA
jgi:hypothetical protein